MTKYGNRLRKARFPLIRLGAVLACCLGVALCAQVRPAQALVQGSVHDFSSTGPYTKTLGPNGLCSACHVAHKGQGDNVIWSRSLVEEKADFSQKSSPNYAPGFTILCYDCHDNHKTGVAGADDDPPDASFDTNRRPQDVAFDLDMRNPLPANNPRDGSNTDGKPGYYENVPSGTVGGASTYISGHYVKYVGINGSIAAGDKLPCSDCHNPHSTSNQAFIRSTLGGKAVTGRKASTKMAYAPVTLSRDDADSRQLCIACHGTSDAGSTPVQFRDVNPAYGTTLIAKPPTKISAHAASKTTACTACHAHNAISASCSDCHGFPPLRTIAQAGGSFDKVLRPDVENYTGGAGAHQRHLDALGVTIFQCEICHGTDPGSATWHNFGGGVFPGVNPGQNVDIMGESKYWDPNNSRTTALYTGTASGETLPALYEFKAKGGGDQHCANLACHGDPTEAEATGVLTWTADMVDGDILVPAWENPSAGNIKICKWCHDATPSTVDGGLRYAPIVMGNGLATAAGFGAEVNGHGVGLVGAVKAVYDKDDVNDGLGAAGAAKDCLVCHDAIYSSAAPRRTHFPTIHAAATDPRDATRLKDTINTANITNSAVFPTGPDQACSACHQNNVNTVLDGLDAAYHGIPPQPPPVGGYVPSEGAADPPFTRACRQCHDVHGGNWNGTGRNLFMVGTWIDVNGDRLPSAGDGAYVDSNASTALANITSGGGPANDNPVVFTHTNGTSSTSNSFDENDGAYNAADDTDDVCATCHSANTRGGNHSGSPAGIGDLRGANCMTCHDHDYDDIATTADAFMPSGCTGCHGLATADANDTQGEMAFRGQYWPDGRLGIPAYADSDPGAHRRHVQALALQLYGETLAQVVTDTGTNSFTKQKAICAFCHPNPGGGGHNTDFDDGVRDRALRVTVYLDSDDTGARTDVFRRLTVGAGASGLEIASGANRDQTYDYTNLNCTNLTCHNQTATPTGANNWDTPPVWTAANVACSNLACHAAATYTIAHSSHVNGTLALGQPRSYFCTECHTDNATVVAVTNPIPLAHGNGEVDMKFNNAGSLEAAHGGDGFYNKDNTAAPTAPSAGDTAFAYKSGGALSTDPAYARSCYLVYCHGGDNDANVPTSIPDWGGSTTSPSSPWNAAGPLACTACHAAAPPTGRHIVHDNNNPWVPNECGSCHRANNNKTSMAGYVATHVNGSVNMAAAVVYTPPTCTNLCHLVNVATGDWLDANPLACTDCHSGAYFGTVPTSGLHSTGIAMAHDVQFLASAGELPPGTATCTHCHLASGPSSSHKTGSAGVVPPTQNSTETTYSFTPAYVVSYSYAGGCQATCHTDNQVVDTVPAGLPASPWKRRWIGVVNAKPAAANNPGDGVCGNCHGDFVNGWRVNNADQTGTSHTNPYNQGGANPDWMSRHSVCETCHGWGYAGYDRAWKGTAPGHGDGSITMNGPAAPPAAKAGAEYNNVSGGCAAACHSEAYAMNTNSGWPVNYGDFGSGACELCHNNSPNAGCDEIPGTLDDAPIVMGPGTDASGIGAVPKPFDDGAWGYNVNGHGSNGSRVAGLTPNLQCIACHDISDPPNTHFYCPNPPPAPGVLSTRSYSGKPTDTRNANTSHLVSGYLAGANNAEAKQVAFDNYCYATCHPAASVKNMRHSYTTIPNAGANIDAASAIMHFNNSNTTTNNPKQNLWGSTANNSKMTPWTVDDLTNVAGVNYNPPTAQHHGVCVSCHDPHGTNPNSADPLIGTHNQTGAGGTNLMLLHPWLAEQMQPYCHICHQIP